VQHQFTLNFRVFSLCMVVCLNQNFDKGSKSTAFLLFRVKQTFQDNILSLGFTAIHVNGPNIQLTTENLSDYILPIRLYDFKFFIFSTCNTDRSVVCEQKACLLTENTINTVNSLSGSLGWTARNYTEFWGRSYDDGLMLRLGTFEPINVRAMRKLSNKPPPKLPSHFNSIDHWRGLIRDVRDQGWCGSSWAMSTISVASDRFSIQSNAKENIELSPQNLLSCDVKGQRGCHGGHLDRAWNYLKKTGYFFEKYFIIISWVPILINIFQSC
jgi:hypothetical protein